MKTRVELLTVWTETEPGIRIGDQGYIDGYVNDPTGVRAVVVFGEQLALIPLYELKVIPW